MNPLPPVLDAVTGLATTPNADPDERPRRIQSVKRDVCASASGKRKPPHCAGDMCLESSADGATWCRGRLRSMQVASVRCVCRCSGVTTSGCKLEKCSRYSEKPRTVKLTTLWNCPTEQIVCKWNPVYQNDRTLRQPAEGDADRH